MSASVFVPTRLNEFDKLRSPLPIQRHQPSARSIAKVKRDLFGPVDREDSKRFLDREFAKQREKSCKKWGFDFELGVPVKGHDKYAWEFVSMTKTSSITETPSLMLTGMITLTTSAHERECLLDKRADRSNLSMSDDSSINNEQFSSPGSDSDIECIKTYPMMPITRNKAIVFDSITPITSSSSTSSCKINNCNNKNACDNLKSSPKTENAVTKILSSPSILGKRNRQPRITDYLKERKRLSPTSPKPSPAKKSKSTLVSSSPSMTTTTKIRRSSSLS
uniref:Putative dacapo n=1 Tax=Corethrella appendiculata TaxID=1370023 RepID=U5EPM7_9DIPT